MNIKDIVRLAHDIREQCRAEYPAEVYDEAVSEMASAVIFADGLSSADASRLRTALGL
jgi:hypothetical protein